MDMRLFLQYVWASFDRRLASLPSNQDIDDISLFCCSHVFRHTSFMSLLGASRPVISSKATMAISLTFSSPSTTTHEGLTVSL